MSTRNRIEFDDQVGAMRVYGLKEKKTLDWSKEKELKELFLKHKNSSPLT